MNYINNRIGRMNLFWIYLKDDNWLGCLKLSALFAYHEKQKNPV